jgi:hypothetical protein
MKPKYYEEEYQISVANYLRSKYPMVLFTISPALFIKSMFMAKRIKAMGYRAGTPDLMIFEQRGDYHGLFIEMKTPETYFCKKGKVSTEQVAIQGILLTKGYQCVVCYGSEEAIKVIDDYMNLR